MLILTVFLSTAICVLFYALVEALKLIARQQQLILDQGLATADRSMMTAGFFQSETVDHTVSVENGTGIPLNIPDLMLRRN